MAKVLYITANPKEVDHSYSLTLGQYFLDQYKNQNPNDEIIHVDVYKDYIPLIDEDVFTGWGKLANSQDLSEEEQKKVNRMTEIVEQFIAADKYVFVTPLWNLSVPPMMRAYIDSVMIAGRTFRYTEEGYPEGLLKNKKAVHIQARGGFYSEGPAAEMEMGDQYLKNIITFMGVTDYQSVIMEGHAHEPSRLEEFKKQAMEQAEKVAKEF